MYRLATRFCSQNWRPINRKIYKTGTKSGFAIPLSKKIEQYILNQVVNEIALTKHYKHEFRPIKLLSYSIWPEEIRLLMTM